MGFRLDNMKQCIVYGNIHYSHHSRINFSPYLLVYILKYVHEIPNKYTFTSLRLYFSDYSLRSQPDESFEHLPHFTDFLIREIFVKRPPKHLYGDLEMLAETADPSSIFFFAVVNWTEIKDIS